LLQFPNSKKNSFRGNYVRKYGICRGCQHLVGQFILGNPIISKALH
jgi:hypothetical protein